MFVMTQTPVPRNLLHVLPVSCKAKKQGSAANKVSKIQLKKTAPILEMTDTLRQVKGSIECSASAVGACLAE